jgi:predicted nuclease of predicted toxin-antitoxin system
VTEDKDFGELVFVRRLPHRTIIRFIEMRVEEQVAAMRELLDYYPTELQGETLIVVTRGRVRIRY